MMPVPNGLAPDVAALTEPMAVAWHAVRRGEVGKRTVAIVIGCGPVGLGGDPACSRPSGVRTVVASDYSPGPPRAGHARCGADVVVDPAHGSPYAAAGDRGHLDRPARPRSSSPSGRARSSTALPVGWWHVWRARRDARRRAQAPGDLRVRRRARA